MPRLGRLAPPPSTILASLPLLLPLLLPLPLMAGCGLDTFVDTDLGDAPRCGEVDRWPAASADAEDDLLDALDDLRQAGAECEGEVVDGVGPLEPIPALQCAARLHAGDLIRHPEQPLGHEGTDGSSALARVNAAGYDGITRHELLAGDYAAADALVEAWQGSIGHCEAVLDDDLDHVGVAQAQSPKGDRIVWVVVTGQERR